MVSHKRNATECNCQPSNEKEGLYCVVHHSKRGPKEIAAHVRKSLSYILNAANEDLPDFNFQSALIAPVRLFTGNTAHIEALCRDCKGIFVPIPDAVADHEEMSAHTAKVLHEVADVIQVTGKALANDGDIDKSECADMEREIDQAVAVLVGLKARARQMAGLSPLHVVAKENAQ